MPLNTQISNLLLTSAIHEHPSAASQGPSRKLISSMKMQIAFYINIETQIVDTQNGSESICSWLWSSHIRGCWTICTVREEMCFAIIRASKKKKKQKRENNVFRERKCWGEKSWIKRGDGWQGDTNNLEQGQHSAAKTSGWAQELQKEFKEMSCGHYNSVFALTSYGTDQPLHDWCTLSISP